MRATFRPLVRALGALGGLLCVLLGCPFSMCGSALAVGNPTSVQADLSHQMRLAGGASGAYVYDLSTRQTLFSRQAGVLRAPASVEKLYTATTALQLMGPTGRLATAVLGAGRLTGEGVWEGSLYLRGGGDPTFGSSAFIRRNYSGVGARVSALTDQLVNVDHIREVTGPIEGDESYLDPFRGEPSSGYGLDPFLEGDLSALAFDRGATGTEHGPHAPATYAARRLWAGLKAAGVKLDGSIGAAPTPPASTPLAQVLSPTVAQLLALMLPPSDNFFAETLLKDLGARFGGSGSTGAGAGVVQSTIASLIGIRPRVVDGSGLSPADHTSPGQVARLLVALAPTPLGAVLRGAMAVAGRTGTLAHRMRGTSAAGRCQGKTGTLATVSNLVGYCEAAGGHLLAFAFFTDAIGIEEAHTIQDHMTITLAGY